MRRFSIILAGLCFSTLVRAEAFPSIGQDTVSSEFFRLHYLTGDLGHYLDNYSDYVFYEAETTGEWNLTERQVFSISGNSFRQNKFSLNGMRIDSRFSPGSTDVITDMHETGLLLDYHAGTLSLMQDSVAQPAVSLTYNAGGLGGISPGTTELINTFHLSGAQRTMDNRPIEMRNHLRGAVTAQASYNIPACGRQYGQHAYVYVADKVMTAFDETGITGMTPSLAYRAQLDGELPLKQNACLDHLNYIVLARGRGDLYSEYLYNTHETATQRTYSATLYGNKRFHNGGELTTGLNWTLNDVRHNTITFERNLIDQDGEAFDPWYADGYTNELNWSADYRQQLLPWLRLRVKGYNSLVHFSPTTTDWSNTIYAQNMGETRTDLYRYDWTSSAFTAGLLDNEAVLETEYAPNDKLSLFGRAGVTLDGVVVRNRAIISPNAVAKLGLDVHPCRWFRMGVSLSHERMSYTYDEARYLSPDYLNANIYSPDATLMATSGGAYHTPIKNLWAHQPSYFVFDLPIRFTFGRKTRHEISILSSARKYYNMWMTTYTDGVAANMYEADGHYYWTPGEKQYTIGLQPAELMSSKWILATPLYLSNEVKYTFTGKKVFLAVSWQSYLMSGLTTLGNGVLHNNIGVLSESSANPDTYVVACDRDMPYAANARVDQDRSFIARIQFTYNVCKYFSAGLNFKFKDGQPFSNFMTYTHTDANGHTQMAICHDDAKGINMHTNLFGKREDAFFNLDLHLTGRWWVKDFPMQLDVTCYNLYDFGTGLTEYTFDNVEHPSYSQWTVDKGQKTLHESRTSMSLSIPRGLIVRLTIGLTPAKHE